MVEEFGLSDKDANKWQESLDVGIWFLFQHTAVDPTIPQRVRRAFCSSVPLGSILFRAWFELFLSSRVTLLFLFLCLTVILILILTIMSTRFFCVVVTTLLLLLLLLLFLFWLLIMCSVLSVVLCSWVV